MLILALESSAKPASVAVCGDGALLGQYFQNNGLTHSRTLLTMAESLLINLDMTVAEIDLVAVACGPGSFTGVRIGVSAAKGLAWGLDKPVCGVSTLEAMAYQFPEPGVLLCPVMDARRGQVYNALFEWRGDTLARLCEDRAICLEELESGLREHAGRAAPRIVLIGDGAEMTYGYLAGKGVDCRAAPQLLRYQTALGVALAARGKQPVSPAELEPSYLRPSQAERERAAASAEASTAASVAATATASAAASVATSAAASANH